MTYRVIYDDKDKFYPWVVTEGGSPIARFASDKRADSYALHMRQTRKRLTA